MAFIGVGILVAVSAEMVFQRWPLSTWRVDLDDFLTSIGTFGIGVGAYLTGRAALTRANEAHDKAENNGHSEHDLERKEEEDFLNHDARIRELEQTWLRWVTPGGDEDV
jgi:hypothetical protein